MSQNKLTFIHAIFLAHTSTSASLNCVTRVCDHNRSKKLYRQSAVRRHTVKKEAVPRFSILNQVFDLLHLEPSIRYNGCEGEFLGIRCSLGLVAYGRLLYRRERQCQRDHTRRYLFEKWALRRRYIVNKAYQRAEPSYHRHPCAVPVASPSSSSPFLCSVCSAHR